MAEASGRTATSQAYVRVDGLKKAYAAHQAVAGVSFSVPVGETLALLGPSGCGKTTMLRCLAGLEIPEQGTIVIGTKTVFDGQRGINLMPEERELGIVFQSYAVWPHMTVAENVGFPLKVRRTPAAEIAKSVDDILAMVGLSAWRDRSAMALSGGQQQRVALARALVHRPQLVLFDEPMSNLDTQLREQMRVELKLLQQKLAFTSVYVTHDQSEAFALAQTVAVMSHGRIDAVGEPRAVFRRPQTPFVAQFFGYNVLSGTVTAAEAGRAQVDIGGVRLWGMADRAMKAGDRAALCVRKEHVALGSSSDQSAPGTLRAIAFQGQTDDYVIALGSAELRASGTSSDIAPGPVTVSLNSRDCIVLSAA